MKLLALFAIFASAACQADFGDVPYFETFDDNSTVSQANVACSVRIGQDTGNPQPLFIRPGTSQWFHPADRRGVLELAVNQEIELACSGSFSTPTQIGTVSGTQIRIACSGGTRFRFNNILYNFNEFTCRNWPTYVAQRRATTTRCFNQGTIVDIGFQVGTRFLRSFTSCHDPRTEENYYTEYQLTPAADGQERNVERPNWAQGDFFPGKNVDIMHTRNNQRSTIATIVGSSALAERYIEPTPSDVFLARGHMAAMTDFITANEQRSTFLFINSAPQWQTFNGFNWVSVEISSRRLASDRNIVLDTYTGTFGITQLRDTNNVNRRIFIDGRNNQIPVPQLYYKILVNRAAQSGVVLIGVNNPHLTLAEILSNYVICTDVSSRINYVSWQRTNLSRGYGYACDVNDFLRVVPHIPGLTVRSLLV
jgi:DNA/RNA endonuclease G (NUC1)